MIIPQYVTSTVKMLTDAGYECYLVGGCVRDRIMGKIPNDYDLTTSALPGQMKDVFRSFSVIETGIKHGTLTVLSDGHPIEITTYRVDGQYLDNRHPDSVRFTARLEDDLARRDFTVNAIAADKEGNITDIFGGEDDIRNRVIRCVGQPDMRFKEDGLRIMRAIRFSSVLDFDIESATALAVKDLKYLLGGISVERITAELTKLLCGVGCARVLGRYADVISAAVTSLDAEKTAEFSLAVKDMPCDPACRFAALLFCSSDDTESTLGYLKVSNKLKNEVMSAWRLFGQYTVKHTDIASMIYGMGFERMLLYADTMRAMSSLDRYGYLSEKSERVREDVRFIKDNAICLNVSQLAVNGADLISAGVPAGESIGEILSFLFESVVDGKVENDRKKLMSMVGDIIS